jgi:ABC-2 type transport system ATP-binding protein
MSGVRFVRMMAELAGLPPAQALERAHEAFFYVGLGEARYRNLGTYSLGMKQMAKFAQAIVHGPELLILDEPTNGLDPAGQREIRALIPQLAREGRSVLLASHLLHEVEQVCDRVAILRRGKLVQVGAVSEIVGQGTFLEINVAEPERAAAIIRALPFVERVSVQDDGSLAVFTPEEQAPDITRALSEASLYVSKMTRRRHSLEEVFLELTEAETSSPAVGL